MFQKLLFCLVLSAVFLLNASEHDGLLGFRPGEKLFYGDERPPRNIRIGKKPEQIWRRGDYLPYILIAPDAPETVRYAASELKKYLDKRFDTQIAVSSRFYKGRKYISLGINEFSKAAGINDSLLCRDAFIIKSVNGNLYILGRDDAYENVMFQLYYGGVWSLTHERGTLFGVYDFLERFAGLRLYFPDENGICLDPPTKPMLIPSIDIFDRPDYEDRRTQLYNCTWDDDAPKKDLYAQSRSPDKNYYASFLRWSTKLVPTNHGLLDLKLNERFGTSHPEYFIMTSGGKRSCGPAVRGQAANQLCYSSKVTEVIKADAAAVVSGQPPSSRGISCPYDAWPPNHLSGRIFSAMPNDGFRPCHCPQCAKLMDSEQHISNTVWRFTADIARHVRKVNPDAAVTQMAYWPYRAVPEVNLPENVYVQLGVTGPLNMNAPEALEEELKLIRSWKAKLGRKVWLWNYCNKYGTSKVDTIPGFLPRMIGAYYKLLRDDIYGAFLQSDSDNLLNAYLNHYVMMKVAWNLDTDVEALLDEHHRRMFGPGAAPMKKFYDQLETLWSNQFCRRRINTALGPTVAPPPLNETWMKIYSEAKLKELAGYCRSAENLALQARDDRALQRIRYIRSRLLDPMLKARRDYLAAHNTIEDYYFVLPQKLPLKPVFREIAEPVKTTVSVSLDPQEFQAKFICMEPEMKQLPHYRRKNGDEKIWQDDDVEIFINANGGRQSFFQIMVNASGNYTVLRKDNGLSENLTPNCTISVHTRRHAGYWEAQISIPRTLLGPVGENGMTANFSRSRYLGGTPEYYSVSPFLTPQSGFCDISGFARFRLSPPEKEAGNLIRGGDFARADLPDWKSNRSADFSAVHDADHGFRSPGSLRLTRKKVSLKQPLAGAWQRLPGLIPGKRYKLTYFVKTHGVVTEHPDGGARVQIWVGRNYFIPVNGVQNTTEWLKQSAEFTVPANAKPEECTIRPQLAFASGTAWFDDISIVPLP